MSYYSSGGRSRYQPSSSINDRRGSAGRVHSNLPGLSSYNYDWATPKPSSSSKSAPLHYYNTYSLPRSYNKSTTPSGPKSFYAGASSSKATGGYLLGHYTIAPIVCPPNSTLSKYQHLYNGAPKHYSANLLNQKSNKGIAQPPRRAPSPEFVQREQKKQELQSHVPEFEKSKTVSKYCDALPNNKRYKSSAAPIPDNKSRLSLKKRLSSSLSSLVTSISGSLSNLAALSPSSSSKPSSSVAYYETSSEDEEEYYFDEYSDSVRIILSKAKLQL